MMPSRMVTGRRRRRREKEKKQGVRRCCQASLQWWMPAAASWYRSWQPKAGQVKRVEQEFRDSYLSVARRYIVYCYNLKLFFFFLSFLYVYEENDGTSHQEGQMEAWLYRFVRTLNTRLLSTKWERRRKMLSQEENSFGNKQQQQYNHRQ